MKKFILIAIVIILIAAGYGMYLFNKPHQGISNIKPEVTLSATELYETYDLDEDKANTRFLGKVIAVSGDIEEISVDTASMVNLILKTGGMGAISCKLDKTENETSRSLERGKKVFLKGKCSGKLMDVVLTDCILLNDNL